MRSAAVAFAEPTIGLSTKAAASGIAYRGSPKDAAYLASPEREQAMAWDQTIDELHSIMQLRDDWDGLGARAPSPALAVMALRVAESFRDRKMIPPGSVVASLGGTVVFEWQIDGFYTELEITGPYDAEVMMAAPRAASTHFSVTTQQLLSLKSFVA
jgi:hypothetical protein